MATSLQFDPAGALGTAARTRRADAVAAAPTGRPSDPRPADDVPASVARASVAPASLIHEAPYPLLRRFLLTVLPVLVLALLGLLAIVAVALSTVVERAYEAETARRHASVVSAIATQVPDALAALAEGRQSLEGTARVRDILTAEANELGLSCIAVIALNTTAAVASGSECPEMTAERRAGIVHHIRDLDAPGATLFDAVATPSPRWLVASMPSGLGGLPIAVGSIQESLTWERVIDMSTLAWVGGLALVLVAATGVAILLVVRAQREIDRRTAALNSARDTLGRFVSRHVRVNAAGGATARRCEATVLFMDIRDFSGFADRASPEDAAALVTTVAEIGFSAVLGHGGDVDRLTGDGLIARFDGPDRGARAFAAAQEILALTAEARTPRAVGIGLMDGEIVEATIAAGDRADATILGRTVNLGARLCSAAGPGEIVAVHGLRLPPSVALAERGIEMLALKGHRDPLAARRYALRPTAAA